MPEKFYDWNMRVVFYRAKNLRLGQSYMNALADIDIELYRDWSGKPWDCFFSDDKCHIFMAKLQKEWS